MTEATAPKTSNIALSSVIPEHAEKEAKEETAEAAQTAAQASLETAASAGDAVPEQGKRRKRKKKKSAGEDESAVEGVAQYDEYKVVLLMT